MPRELRITIAVTVPIPDAISADAFREADFVSNIRDGLAKAEQEIDAVVGDEAYEWDTKARVVTLKRGESEPAVDSEPTGLREVMEGAIA